ncbi:MAG: FAD-binding oxidoreductase [Bacteriovoracia bacterium]
MKDLSSEFAKRLAQKFKYLADDLHALRTYSKDLWPRNLILAREVDPSEPTVDAVFWPDSVNELSEFVLFANENNIEMIPYGAGSGVCGGSTPLSKANNRRVVVDLKRLDKIEAIDEISQTAKVQAGIIGQVLEEDLNQKGYTFGHFPSSIYCSSFGGYLATRAAGQLSTYYGKIEDMVLSIQGVLPDGTIFETCNTPRMSVGPDWNQLLMGSEGSLAFLTSAWVKIHRLPQNRRFLSWTVKSSAEALDGVRQWLQAGLRPAVIRIYDEDESRMLMGIKDGVKLVCVVEGDTDLTEFTANQIEKNCHANDSFNFTGEEPAQHWWSHRYDVSYRQQQIMSHRRLILDTFEVATTWSKLIDLHKAIKQVPSQFKNNTLIILAHFSHFYHTGGNIYFTLCGVADEKEKTVDFYDKVWDALLTACANQGAALSHHHGIGRLKARAFQKTSFAPLLRKLKNELDPKHLLNAENLGL